MMKITQIEFAKLKKYHVLKILFLAYMVVIPGWMYFMDFFFSKEQDIKSLVLDNELFVFPHIWSFTTFCASFFNILLSVIIVIVTCNELQYKTMRQNIIDGLTKQQVILGKFVVVVALSIFATLYTFLVTLVIGGIYGDLSGAFENIHLVFYYFLQTLGYFSFAFLFALIVRRPAIAIIAFILYFPVEFIIGKLITADIYQFFPLKVYADLTPVPFFKHFLAAREAATHQDIWVMSESMKLVFAGAYILLFFFLGYWTLKRRDL